MDDLQAEHNVENGEPFRQEGGLPVSMQNGPGHGGAYSNRAYSYANAQRAPADTRSNAQAIIRILLHRWVTVLLVGIMGGLIGILYLANCTPIYKARAELEMSVRRPRVINNEVVYDDLNSAYDEDVIFNTRFAKFKSPAMEGLASKEYIDRYPEHEATKIGREINRYSLALWIREVEWYKDPTANIVHVSYEDPDPEFASQLVNVLSDCAGKLMMRENKAQSDEAVKWLVLQASDQRNVLEEEEQALAKLRDELQLDSLQQQKAALGQALVTVSEEKETLISDLASKKTIHAFVVELKNSDPNMEMLPSGLPREAELNDRIQSWRNANDEMLQVADRYTKLHPEYKNAAELEARSRSRLEQFIDLSARSLNNEIDLMEKQLQQVNERIEEMKSDAIKLEQRLATGLQKVQRLERKRDAADDSYRSMLRRMEEARLSADEDMAFTKIIRRAIVPREPVSPQKILVLIFSIFIGLFTGSVFAVISGFWTDKIIAVADLKALGLNILATIPSQKKVDSRAHLATIGLRDKFNPMVEIFAGINTLISSGKNAGQTQVVLVCSVGPGEGKTISACNLAISSAFNKTRTLLIDGDLRRPQLGNIFNIDESHASLLSWLSANEDSDIEPLVTHGVIENLDLITSMPDELINPAELLGRDGLAKLIAWARENYDRVVIDTPPVGPVGDAHVWANLADAVILVSRIGKTKRRAINFALSRFQEINASVVGCVANDVPHSLAGMFGGAEGYGYSYGYGNYGYNK